MLGGRLRAARHARFVGRAAEKAQFEAALAAPELPYFVLHLYGPGGVGKTTLLREFALLAEQRGGAAAYLDARNIEAVPEAFTAALEQAVNLPAGKTLGEHLTAYTRFVLLIDTCETLAPLDDWLREVFLVSLPENVLVVLAGRYPPGAAWRTDIGWQTLAHSLALRNLSPDDGQDYLQRRAVPADQIKAVLDFTHGHPLALTLVADAFAQRGELRFEPGQVPDVIHTLLTQFVQKVPGPAHRAALEVSPLVRITTETLLEELLGVEDAHELFTWLQGLSFMENGPEGLFPHDLAREALLADLRWRNPEWYAELHRRARHQYIRRLNQTSGMTQQRILADLIFLHRDNPVVKPLFEWKPGGHFTAEPMRPTDITALKAMVAQHEGEEAGRLAKFWLSRQPENALVLRESNGVPGGFLLALSLEKIHPDDYETDPAVKAARGFLSQQAALRPGERATLFRFWMAAGAYQSVSPAQSLLFVHIVRHYIGTPGLAYTLIPCADPDFWSAGFEYAVLQRLPQADYTVEGRRYGVFGHDWRAMPPAAWLDVLGEREIAMFTPGAAPVIAEQVIVLSEANFAAAVHNALKDYTRPENLRDNPLLKSRLVMEQAGSGASEAERIAALRALIRAAADSLQQVPRQTRFYRPLYHTYIQAAATQEQAAELLDLPFSTYRRHLRSGIERVTSILWLREIGGDPGLIEN
jgi:RecA/RadA recombinase